MKNNTENVSHDRDSNSIITPKNLEYKFKEYSRNEDNSSNDHSSNSIKLRFPNISRASQLSLHKRTNSVIGDAELTSQKIFY